MKTVFSFSHSSLDYTYRDFPNRECAEEHRTEVAEDLEVPAIELVIETYQVEDDEFVELMDYAGFSDDDVLATLKSHLFASS